MKKAILISLSLVTLLNFSSHAQKTSVDVKKDKPASENEKYGSTLNLG